MWYYINDAASKYAFFAKKIAKDLHFDLFCGIIYY